MKFHFLWANRDVSPLQPTFQRKTNPILRCICGLGISGRVVLAFLAKSTEELFSGLWFRLKYEYIILLMLTLLFFSHLFLLILLCRWRLFFFFWFFFILWDIFEERLPISNPVKDKCLGMFFGHLILSKMNFPPNLIFAMTLDNPLNSLTIFRWIRWIWIAVFLLRQNLFVCFVEEFANSLEKIGVECVALGLYCGVRWILVLFWQKILPCWFIIFLLIENCEVLILVFLATKVESP